MAILSDEFYYQPIRIDTINTRVFADIVAKEGDANGRGLLVTLTENGLVKNTTGIALNLKWEHTAVGNQGLDNFEAVDLSKGLYKITYPTEMLNRGKVNAFIQILDGGKNAGSRNVEITVDRGVGDDTAIVSSNSFSALVTALLSVNNLESTYAPRLLSAEQQLEHATKYVNILDYKADDGDAAMFRRAIKDAYNKTLILTGWRSPFKIKIPSGVYEIDSTILDNELGVSAGRFIFEGEGWQNTIINFKPLTSIFLIDNQGLIGFSEFYGINIISNHLGKFMNGVGGGSGNSQSFVFDRMRFENFKTIIDSNGGTMMSEVTFDKCKIVGGNDLSELFIFNNSQAVNWRFFGVDIEGFTGTLFKYLKGTSIYVYQGSIIPSSIGIVINVPSTSDSNSFGEGNSPHVNFFGSRFEMRDDSKIIQSNQENVIFDATFNACGMGGLSRLTSTVPVFDLKQNGTIVFNDCKNWSNVRLHDKPTETSYVSPKKIIFNRCSLNKNSFLRTVTYETITNNGGYAVIDFDGDVYRSRSYSDFNAGRTPKPHILTFEGNNERFIYCSGIVPTNRDIILTGVVLRKIKFVTKQSTGYGAYNFGFKFYNHDKSLLLLEGTTNIGGTTDTLSETSSTFRHFVSRVSGEDKIILELTPITTTSPDVFINGWLELVY